MTAEPFAVQWVARPVPLTPEVVVAPGASVARTLLRRTLAEADETLADWGGVATPGGTAALLLLRPDAAPLPWVDGVFYLGRDPSAPSAFYLPTNQMPTIPAAILYRALRVQVPNLHEPFAVWPSTHDGLALLSLSAARALDRSIVAAWN